MAQVSLSRRASAEFIGTFWLVFGGCGSAVLAAAIPELGIGYTGVSLAFGLTVLTMAYAIGHISGCHLNPAVSVGLCVGKRFPASELLPYIVMQVLGAIAGAGILYVIANASSDSTQVAVCLEWLRYHSPVGYACWLFRCRSRAHFLFPADHSGSTDSRAPAGFAPIPSLG